MEPTVGEAAQHDRKDHERIYQNWLDALLASFKRGESDPSPANPATVEPSGSPDSPSVPDKRELESQSAN